MPPPRPIHPKEREVYELNSDEDFLLGHNAKVVQFFISPTFYFKAASWHLISRLRVDICNDKYWHVSFLTLVFGAFQGML